MSWNPLLLNWCPTCLRCHTWNSLFHIGNDTVELMGSSMSTFWGPWWNLHITSNTEMLRKLFNGFHTVSFHVTLLINIYLVFLLLLPLSPFYFRPDELQMVTSTQPELEGRSGLGSQYTMRCSSITGMCQPVLNFLARLVFTMSLC